MSCNCTFKTGIEVVNRIKEKGFTDLELTKKHVITCECKQELIMGKCLTICPSCKRAFGVTPCHQADIKSVVCVEFGEY